MRGAPATQRTMRTNATGRYIRPARLKRGAKSTISIALPSFASSRVFRIEVLRWYSWWALAKSSSSIRQTPSSCLSPLSSAQNTGSPSTRGTQPHTSPPVSSINPVTWQLPTGHSSSELCGICVIQSPAIGELLPHPTIDTAPRFPAFHPRVSRNRPVRSPLRTRLHRSGRRRRTPAWPPQKAVAP